MSDPQLPPPPPPPKSRTGLLIALLVASVVLLLLLVGGVIVLSNVVDDLNVATSSTTDRVRRSTTSDGATDRTAPTTIGPTTSVAGTGAPSTVTALSAANRVRDEQLKATPDLRVESVICPRSPYRVGHVFVCRMRLEDTEVYYRVEVTSPDFIKFGPTKPIVDTDKAEELMESREPGTTADCGPPRLRQLDVGAQLTCESESSTWDFRVTPDGELSGTRR